MPQGIPGGAEGDEVPGDVRGAENTGLQFFVARGQVSGKILGNIGDNHGLGVVVGKDIEEAYDPDLEVSLLESFSDYGVLYGLPHVHKAAGDHPLAVARFYAPADHDQAVLIREEGNDRQFGVEVENEAAGSADQPFRFVGLKQPLCQAAAALGAEFIHIVSREP